MIGLLCWLVKTISFKDNLDNIWREKLDLSVDGKGLLNHRDVPKAHWWAREPTRILSGKDFIRVNHLRYNLLLTGQLKHRMCCTFFIHSSGVPDLMAQEISGTIKYVSLCRKD